MTLKKSILIITLITITVFSIVILFANLFSSFNQPQVQEKLEVYQTDIVLQAAEFEMDAVIEDDNTAKKLTYLRNNLSLGGQSPYVAARSQYLKARQAAKKNIETFTQQLDKLASASSLEKNPGAMQIRKEISDEEKFIDKLNLRLGMLYAVDSNQAVAEATWQELIHSPEDTMTRIAAALTQLWEQPPVVADNTEALIESQLTGWFRYRALKQFYQAQNQENQLQALVEQEQISAQNALLKLVGLTSIPIIGGAFGVGLFIFLLIQLAWKKGASLIARNYNKPWPTPWDGLVIWAVLIIGFFFWGQMLLPIFLGVLGTVVPLNVAEMTMRGKAVYVLFNYLALAAGGLSVLYISLKRFFPLDKDWFRCQWRGTWPLWGLGGYLIALPSVVLVSLLNQQIWGGQGGSNPLLSFALEAQDPFVLVIFFFTAAIAAPLYEEIMFRGFLLPSLTRYVPVWGAIVISGLIFAIAHLNLSEVLPLLVLGIILGIVYTRSRNLLASILLHSLWNSGTLFSLFILGTGAN